MFSRVIRVLLASLAVCLNLVYFIFIAPVFGGSRLVSKFVAYLKQTALWLSIRHVFYWMGSAYFVVTRDLYYFLIKPAPGYFKHYRKYSNVSPNEVNVRRYIGELNEWSLNRAYYADQRADDLIEVLHPRMKRSDDPLYEPATWDPKGIITAFRIWLSDTSSKALAKEDAKERHEYFIRQVNPSFWLPLRWFFTERDFAGVYREAKKIVLFWLQLCCNWSVIMDTLVWWPLFLIYMIKGKYQQKSPKRDALERFLVGPFPRGKHKFKMFRRAYVFSKVCMRIRMTAAYWEGVRAEYAWDNYIPLVPEVYEHLEDVWRRWFNGFLPSPVDPVDPDLYPNTTLPKQDKNPAGTHADGGVDSAHHLTSNANKPSEGPYELKK